MKGNITSLLNLEFDNSFKVKKFDLNISEDIRKFLKLEKPLEYITFKEKLIKLSSKIQMFYSPIIIKKKKIT